ncbi:DMT family transporter [Methylobacterium sp. NEAU K]|uniref:DMT family transporter n=1 Tax=Methylobacterium sp. NEAU K TaxID=3064946 RepID=UPI00351E24A4
MREFLSSSSVKTDASRNRATGLVWGSVGVLAFSVSLPVTRLAVAGGIAGSFVGIGRAAVAGVLALLTLAIMRQPLPSFRLMPRLAVVAVGVVLGFPLLTSLALTHVPASHGVVVAGLLPSATAVMAVFRAGEHPSLRFWIAVLAGVACVLTFVFVQGGGSFQWADALLLAAVVLCALGYAEGGALARELGGVQVMCIALIMALPVTVPITLIELDVVLLAHITPAAWAGFAYLCVVSNAGFFAWYRGLSLGGVARISQLQLAQPVLSLAWGWLLLGEVITGPTIAAALGVLTCVVMAQWLR